MAKLDQNTRAKLKVMLEKHKQQKKTNANKLRTRISALRPPRPPR